MRGSSRCELHQQGTRKIDERPSPAQRGYDSTWRAVRARFLKNNPLCEQCGEPATEVHHITPLSHGGTHDVGNLVALCKRCHSSITAQYGGGWGNKRG